MKYPVRFSVEDRAKCQVHIIYNIDDMSYMSSVAKDMTRHCLIHDKRYELSFTIITVHCNRRASRNGMITNIIWNQIQ